MKLIALDLDGTTLNSQKEITEETVQAIRKAQQAGHIVMVLSGRTVKSIRAELEKYDLQCPIGASNGTILYVDGQLIEMTSLTRLQAQRIHQALEEEGVPFNFTTHKGSFAPSNWGERLDNMLSSGRIPQHYFENSHYKMFTTHPTVYGHTLTDQLANIIQDDDFTILKASNVALDPEQKERLERAFAQIEQLQIASSSPFNIEVTHIDGHKGNGLRRMAEHFGIPLEDTVALGDEKNDIPMFQMAGLAIAMDNAEEEVKKYSNIVTLSNDENGVAHAIEKYILDVK
ncbi:Cof-type HAD-IIB family hydrolase [Lysinibacillus piscis]|uniref:Haloacid dehalogenase n=1 Tax=Lysinibacillus piscis TaxID=2518931 RepID=A0ABQ5NP66_9BACI|nr:Cof-type HAD-IIB family hydrolase [Lysinibacillus sp. KH24]GLC90098.1 haloacid dehalogenase [Lysinibacillus sp. KH24]